ncbi:MAG: hypothetical protein ABI305_11630 [Tepidiformaceae bacterium]
MTHPDSDSELHLTVVESALIGNVDLERIKTVFATNYREANLAYLEKSLGTLAYIALAEDGAGELVGFAFGESRVLDLPRLPQQLVRLAGLCCVNASHRRHHLFGKLESLALNAGGLPNQPCVLGTGRMAHPASFRGMASNPSSVPHRGSPPTEWQKQVGIAIATAYRTPVFDPETFVCHGSGVPIGFPVIEIDASPEEWELFAPVDRSKGDSLLGISWNPTPPEGWLA